MLPKQTGPKTKLPIPSHLHGLEEGFHSVPEVHVRAVLKILLSVKILTCKLDNLAMVRHCVVFGNGGDSEGTVVGSEVERHDTDLKHKLLPR